MVIRCATLYDLNNILGDSGQLQINWILVSNYWSWTNYSRNRRNLLDQEVDNIKWIIQLPVWIELTREMIDLCNILINWNYELKKVNQFSVNVLLNELNIDREVLSEILQNIYEFKLRIWILGTSNLSVSDNYERGLVTYLNRWVSVNRWIVEVFPSFKKWIDLILWNN